MFDNEVCFETQMKKPDQSSFKRAKISSIGIGKHGVMSKIELEPQVELVT